jgi:large subunit ribosomal protein L9
MKVILLKDVRGVGQRHEIKEVADGYAINALFPSKSAEPATAEKIKLLEAQKAAHQAELQKQEEQLIHKLQMLRGKTVALSARATEKGGLFKSIAQKDIAKAILSQHSLEIPESAIALPVAIKTTGSHNVKLVHKELSVPFMVEVSAA